MNTNNPRFAIFRTDSSNKARELFEELKEGRLRQGWGKPALTTADGEKIEKAEFEEKYEEYHGEPPSSQRYAILSRMLDLEDGDVVVVPKMPEWNKFTIARVSQGYKFDDTDSRADHYHIVRVYPESVRTFHYHANKGAFSISGCFARANHRSAISFFNYPEQTDAALSLLGRDSEDSPKPPKEFFSAAINDAFKAAAEALRDSVSKLSNGQQFQGVVLQALIDQGYKPVPGHPHYDRQGGDADILVSPPAGPFLPGEIAVQVKWKQGEDRRDEQAVSQIKKWAESQKSSAMKCVISSADRFTEATQELAMGEDVILIGGLQTMCLLLGIADRYREDWEQNGGELGS